MSDLFKNNLCLINNFKVQKTDRNYRLNSKKGAIASKTDVIFYDRNKFTAETVNMSVLLKTGLDLINIIMFITAITVNKAL